ncbi:MAG: hypothetical protein HY903_20340 [Deltaproteobacteria bacterium]|nr:hypothetical protein [Deltaproteobacteria bacterium]
MNGTIVGGWEYIWAAYLVTWGSLALYALSLVWRARKAKSGEPQPGSKP